MPRKKTSQSQSPPPTDLPPSGSALNRLVEDEHRFRSEIPDEEPSRPSPKLMEILKDEIRAVFQELATRRIEALSLYEPLASQAAFHKSTAPERLVRGSNRSGKTLCGCVEVARAVCGRDPWQKYPQANGRWFACTTRGREVGLVLYRKLCEPGAFRIIKDLRTQNWRSYRPWEPEDGHRRLESKLAPPLIPRRLLSPKKIGWHSKRESIPSIAKLETGWELGFFSTEGRPPTGVDLDGCLFDEEIGDGGDQSWYAEMSARLLDREGKFVWTATPQAGGEKLYDLSLTAEDQVGKINPRVEEFVTLLHDNPYITIEQKRILAEKYENSEDYRVRISGEFAVSARRIYPEFHDRIHQVEPFPVALDWTRYAIVDPGHQICAVLFVAVPPPHGEYGKRKFFYDELYIPHCTSRIFGERMKAKCEGQHFQAFLIDGRAGRITEMGSGLTIESQYAVALKANGVASQSTGHGFIWGSDDLRAGIESMHGWLGIGPEGAPTLQILRGRCPNLVREIVRYNKRKVGDRVLDEPVKKNDHLVDCGRYAAAFGCPYVRPKGAVKKSSYVIEALRAKRRLLAQKGGSDVSATIRLGPGQSA